MNPKIVRPDALLLNDPVPYLEARRHLMLGVCNVLIE